jgi:hypothetical protein
MFNEKCCYLPTRKRGCAIFLQLQFPLDVEGNIFKQQGQLNFQETEAALCKYKRPDDLASSNTSPKVNRQKVLKCDSVDAWGL